MQIDNISEMVPMDGTMSLLSRIVEYGEESLCAEVDITANSLFAEADGVPAWVGIEYMAQTIAAFAGVKAREAGKEIEIGFLVGSRKYTCNQPVFAAGDTLRVYVEEMLRGKNGLSVFACSIQGKNLEAAASLNVFQPENVGEFLENDLKVGK